MSHDQVDLTMANFGGEDFGAACVKGKELTKQKFKALFRVSICWITKIVS